MKIQNEQLVEIKNIISDYFKSYVNVIRKGQPSGLLNREKYEEQLEKIVGRSVAYALLNNSEREAELYCYENNLVSEKYSYIEAMILKNKKVEYLWNKIFAIDLKNEKNEYGVVYDYELARDILLNGSFEFGELKHQGLRRTLCCGEEVAKSLVNEFDHHAHVAIVRRDQKLVEVLDKAKTGEEVESIIIDWLKKPSLNDKRAIAAAYTSFLAGQIYGDAKSLKAEETLSKE